MRPTPVIKFLSWIYLLIGMENFFWAVFRFIYEGQHGHLTRTLLNTSLALIFISFAIFLSRTRADHREASPRFYSSPVPWAWLVSVLSFLIQYYRYQIWTADYVNNLGISTSLGRYFTIVHMYGTWIAMMASIVLSQEYRRITDTLKEAQLIYNWEMTAGTFRRKGWWKRSMYLELNENFLVIRTHLFWIRRIPIEDIVAVSDTRMFLYPPKGLQVRYVRGKKKQERSVHFVSQDLDAWLNAFETINVPVTDEDGVRGQHYRLYHWWRFYNFTKDAVNAFIAMTVGIMLLSGFLGPLINRDYDDFAKRNIIAVRNNNQYRITPISQRDYRYLKIRDIEFDKEKIVLWVDHSLRRYTRDMPAYFNHLFRDTKLVLYRHRVYKGIRFVSNPHLAEHEDLKNATFLYAYPIARTVRGSYQYRFVYLKRIDDQFAYLISIDTTYHKAKDETLWSRKRGYRVGE